MELISNNNAYKAYTILIQLKLVDYHAQNLFID